MTADQDDMMNPGVRLKVTNVQDHAGTVEPVEWHLVDRARRSALAVRSVVPGSVDMCRTVRGQFKSLVSPTQSRF